MKIVKLKRELIITFIIVLFFSTSFFAQNSKYSSYSLSDVFKEINKKAANYNTKNCLELVLKYEYEAYEGKEIESYDPSGYPNYRSVTKYRLVPANYIQNNCNYSVLIKGIRKQIDSNNRYFYTDASIIIGVGEIFYTNDYYDLYYDGLNYEYQFFKNTGTTSSVKTEEYNSVVAKTISTNTIEITSNTNTTNISVKKGDKINIEASGIITYGVWAGSGDPTGIDGFESYSIISTFKHGALLVRVGNSGNWESVGTSKILTANSNGVLQFIVNDSDPTNNSGSFTVKFKITKLLTNTVTNSKKR